MYLFCPPLTEKKKLSNFLSLFIHLLLRSLMTAASGQTPSSDSEENEYMSPTSLPASGTSWMIAGSSVPPPPTQIHQQGELG